jgi:DNA-binding protein YbaB
MADTERLRRTLADARQAAWAVDRSDITGVGRDSAGVVRVEVDPADAVLRVEIGASWWNEIGRDNLGAVVKEAFDSAVADRQQAWAERVEARGSADDAASAPAPDRDDELVGTGEAPEWDEQLDEVRQALETLRQAKAELRELRQAVRAQQGGQAVGHGPQGRVTVSVEQGRVTAVEFDRRWLNERPTGQDLGSAVVAACQAAYRQSALSSLSSLAQFPTLASARARSQDPVAVFRRLGVVR